MTDEEFWSALVCPWHRGPLARSGDRLLCAAGCDYPVIAGVPFLLRRAGAETNPSVVEQSFRLADEIVNGRSSWSVPANGAIDPVVQQIIGATNSLLYKPLIGHLREYPIPTFPMLRVKRDCWLIDIGCGWGRWCIAAARAGYAPVGVDLSLESVLVASRISAQLGVAAHFVVADSRSLPFAPRTFDCAYSYSVLQHFSKEDVFATLHSLVSVMKPGGIAKLHMLNRYGVRGLQVQVCRGFRNAVGFETRYWSPAELRKCFSEILGPSLLEVDGFFVQGRYEDRQLFRAYHRLLVELSHGLTYLSHVIPALANVADNLFVVSTIITART